MQITGTHRTKQGRCSVPLTKQDIIRDAPEIVADGLRRGWVTFATAKDIPETVIAALEKEQAK